MAGTIIGEFFCAHFCSTEKPTAEIAQAWLGSSLEVISLKAKVEHLTSRCESLTESVEQVEDESAIVREENRRLKNELKALQTTRSSPSRHAEHPSDTMSRYDVKGKGKARANLTPSSSTPSTSRAVMENKQYSSVAGPSGAAWSFAAPPHSDSDSEQAQYNADRSLVENLAWEEERTIADHQLVVSLSQPTFDCCICMDKFPDDFRTLIPGCSHTTCRDCLRQHVLSVLREHRYPVHCPACVSDGPKAGAFRSEQNFRRRLTVNQK